MVYVIKYFPKVGYMTKSWPLLSSLSAVLCDMQTKFVFLGLFTENPCWYKEEVDGSDHDGGSELSNLIYGFSMMLFAKF